MCKEEIVKKIKPDELKFLVIIIYRNALLLF